MFHRICIWLVAGLIPAAISGCAEDGPEIADVEGTVTMDGKPLANASVVFVPQGGRPAGARTDDNGHYVLNFSGERQGALPGKSKVRISTLRDPYVAEDGTNVPGTPETVPAKYNAETILEFEVKLSEANVADFNLDSEGELPPVQAIE